MVKKENRGTAFEGGSLWYQDAVIYQLHVKTFYDGNGDGVGDFKGLARKLDYLQDLGVSAIWLLPFCPSPLKDDGYDIADYTGIHPAYGTLRDFKAFLKEAHKRGLRVITELVVNHTSDQHAWFQKARRAKPGSRWRDVYVWSDTPERYGETRVIFQDFESSNWTRDPLAKAYYWHRFYSHQPDLNYDNPRVRKAILKVLDFWFDLGVDGLRLDAVPYLYEREGTNCENLPETHAFLKEIRKHVDDRFDDRMFIGEANQWPEDAVAYFGAGDECHMVFHFPLMPRMFMALRMEDRFPILDILDQTPAIPETCQWAIFLRNHDELTLEMVTDEERDYMYRVYAQDPQMRINLGIRRRLAPLLNNNRRRIELMTSLLCSMPGTPVIYYGDEIGMGDNIYLGDRNGVRTPMQWSPDRNAGFSAANPQRLYLPVIIDPEYHYETINVEAQQANRQSLLWWTKRLIGMRKRHPAFYRGSMEFLQPDNHHILAYLRQYQEEVILVVSNLSRFVQHVELDLSTFSGRVPVELFGQVEFPPVERSPYPLSLGPHGFYWFILEPQETLQGQIEGSLSQLPSVTVSGDWPRVFSGHAKSSLARILPNYLRRTRWFGGKARRIKAVDFGDPIPVGYEEGMTYVVLLEVDYVGMEDETYVLPLTHASGEEAQSILHQHPWAVVCTLSVKDKGEEGLLVDALAKRAFCEALLELIHRGRSIKTKSGELLATPSQVFRRRRGDLRDTLEPDIIQAEQTNTSVLYGEEYILKLFRRPGEGINPDLEIGRFLTKKGFQSIPAVAGSLEYRREQGSPVALAVLQGFIQNQGDAWTYTLDALGHYLEYALAQRHLSEDTPLPRRPFTEEMEEEIPPGVYGIIGPYLESTRVLGRRTGELHLALASAPEDSGFAPERFSLLYQRSLYQSMRTLTRRNFQILRGRLNDLPESALAEARMALNQENVVLERFRSVMKTKIAAQRIRCHGDYHLGQVLYTGKDFVIIDFEGEPARPISERRIKRSPLRDVAGMLRSFHYAAYSALFAQEERGVVGREDMAQMESWVNYWHTLVCAVFFKAYLEVATQGSFLPKNDDQLETLMDIYLLEKAIYELGYELNNRPDWVRIPLQGIRQLL